MKIKQRQKTEEFPILVVMTTYIVILLMYLFTYSQKSHLFWGFFILERLLTFNYEADMDQYLAHMEAGDLNGIKMIVTMVFSLLSVGIFLYTPFKYPGLFGLLILGEVIDFIGKKIKQSIKFK